MTTTMKLDPFAHLTAFGYDTTNMSVYDVFSILKTLQPFTTADRDTFFSHWPQSVDWDTSRFMWGTLSETDFMKSNKTGFPCMLYDLEWMEDYVMSGYFDMCFKSEPKDMQYAIEEFYHICTTDVHDIDKRGYWDYIEKEMKPRNHPSGDNIVSTAHYRERTLLHFAHFALVEYSPEDYSPYMHAQELGLNTNGKSDMDIMMELCDPNQYPFTTPKKAATYEWGFGHVEFMDPLVVCHAINGMNGSGIIPGCPYNVIHVANYIDSLLFNKNFNAETPVYKNALFSFYNVNNIDDLAANMYEFGQRGQ